MKNSSFNVIYDGGSDVLYVIKRAEAASRGVEDSSGIVWRYDVNGELIGATIMDFYDRWFNDQEALAGRISERFHISPPQAQVVLNHAFDSIEGGE